MGTGSIQPGQSGRWEGDSGGCRSHLRATSSAGRLCRHAVTPPRGLAPRHGPCCPAGHCPRPLMRSLGMRPHPGEFLIRAALPAAGAAFPPHTHGNSCVPGNSNKYLFPQGGMGGKGGHGHAPLAGDSEATGTATIDGRKGFLSPGSWDGAVTPQRTRSPTGTPGDTGGVLWGAGGALSRGGLGVPPKPGSFRPWAIARAAPHPPSPPGSGG